MQTVLRLAHCQAIIVKLITDKDIVVKRLMINERLKSASSIEKRNNNNYYLIIINCYY